MFHVRLICRLLKKDTVDIYGHACKKGYMNQQRKVASLTTCYQIYFQNVVYTILNISAPLGLKFIRQPTFLTVTVIKGDQTGLDHFLISVKTLVYRCETNHRGDTCTISGLSASTKYTIQASACLIIQNSGACGPPTEALTWTAPEGHC